jgi:hypothetical protein
MKWWKYNYLSVSVIQSINFFLAKLDCFWCYKFMV